MDTNSTAQAANPIEIYEMMNAFQKSFALKGAIDLDLFTAIGEGAGTVQALAKRCSASERGIRILCDYLVVAQLLEKSADQYQLTRNSAMFLDRRSPACIGGAAAFLIHSDMRRAYADIATTVRNGRTLLDNEGTVSTDNRVWVDFAAGMAPLMKPAAEEIAKSVVARTGEAPQKILDIAAGHGMFGIASALEFPEAEITACDWDSVLDVAEKNAAAAGVADRFRRLTGDAMQVDFGSGYDLVFLTNFLHHFDAETNERLLQKVYAALAKDGRVITLDFVPNEDRVSPPISAAFSLVMLATTKAGDAYTFSEFETMFHNAGFKRSELIHLQTAPEQVIITYR